MVQNEKKRKGKEKKKRKKEKSICPYFSFHAHTFIKISL